MSNDLVMMAFVAGVILGAYGIKSIISQKPLRSLPAMFGGGSLIYLALVNHIMSLLFK